jgi:hypothetical protein
MSECELASVLFAVSIKFWLISIIVGPSSGARLELRSKPANLEWDLTELTGNLWQRIND